MKRWTTILCIIFCLTFILPCMGDKSLKYSIICSHDNNQAKDTQRIMPSFPKPAEQSSKLDLHPLDTLIYNLTSYKQTRIPYNKSSFRDIENKSEFIPPYLGKLEQKEPPSYERLENDSTFNTLTVFPPDGRQQVTATTSFPWRTICKLFITANDYTEYIGSGAIIDEFHVLTCGHVVYIHDHGGWVRSIKVVPGMDGGSEPYGHAWAINMRTYTGWTNNEDERHDWAVITLDRNIGDYTGWMGRRTADWWSSIYTGTLNSAGYPGDLNGGWYMYSDSNNGHSADEYNHYYYLDIAGGQSGSPVWTFDGTNRYIISIVAYGGASTNFGTRLNQDKYDQIIEWLNIDAGIPPDDKPDLKDQGEFNAGFSPDRVKSGKDTFRVWCQIINMGTASSGSFTVSYYLSKNNYISSSDFLLGNDTVNSINPYYTQSSNWLGTFPTDISKGEYYVGWIIDGGNLISEVSEDNNIGLIESYKLKVDLISPGTIIFFILLGVVGAVVAVLMVRFTRRPSEPPNITEPLTTTPPKIKKITTFEPPVFIPPKSSPKSQIREITSLETSKRLRDLWIGLKKVNNSSKVLAIQGLLKGETAYVQFELLELVKFLSLILDIEEDCHGKFETLHLLSTRIVQNGEKALPYLKKLLQLTPLKNQHFIRSILLQIKPRDI